MSPGNQRTFVTGGRKPEGNLLYKVLGRGVSSVKERGEERRVLSGQEKKFYNIRFLKEEHKQRGT